MSIEAMKQALEALEILARYENPETRIQVRKPKDGGPIVTMYPHKVASDAAQSLRQAIEQAEKQKPFGYFQYSMHIDAWVQNRDSNKGVAFYTTPQSQQAEKREPVAHQDWCIGGDKGPCNCQPQPQREWVDVECPLCGEMAVAHTHPVLNKRKWVGLTDEEIALVCAECAASAHNWNDISFARAIEAKLREKNGGAA